MPVVIWTGGSAWMAAAGRPVVNPAPLTPSWKTVTDFLDRYLKTR